MTNKIKLTLAFVAGAASGITGTYIYMRKVVDRELKTILEEVDRELNCDPDEELQSADHYAIDQEGKVLVMNGKSKIVDFNKEKFLENIKPLSDEELGYKYNTDRPSKTHPYVISLEQYNEENEFEKIDLYYYDEDDTLAGDDDVILQKDVIGDGPLGSFGLHSEDPNIVYVRNERLGIDYQVILVNNSYEEMVAGYSPDTDEE